MLITAMKGNSMPLFILKYPKYKTNPFTHYIYFPFLLFVHNGFTLYFTILRTSIKATLNLLHPDD